MVRHFWLALFAVTATSVLSAQVPRAERRRWIDSTTTVTNDPRRLPVPPGYQAPAGSIILRGGRVWDGTGAPARSATLVITSNRVVALLPPASTAWPKDARVIDVAGKTVMPGLIDLHTHIDYRMPGNSDTRAFNPADGALRGAERLRYYIESGITSLRDTGSDGDTPFILKGWVNEGRLIGPRIFAAGSIVSGKGGHGAEVDLSTDRPLGAMREAAGPDDWREAVREQFRKGADFIKVTSHFSEAEIKAAVEEAHDLGLKITADAETFYIERAVRAGIDMIEHPLPRTDETIRLMAEKGTESDPTLIPYMIIFRQNGGYFGSTSRRFTHRTLSRNNGSCRRERKFLFNTKHSSPRARNRARFRSNLPPASRAPRSAPSRATGCSTSSCPPPARSRITWSWSPQWRPQLQHSRSRSCSRATNRRAMRAWRRCASRLTRACWRRTCSR